MGYTQPAFMVNGLQLGLGTSAITARNASAMSTAGKQAVTDGRAGVLASVTATGSNGGFVFDLGTTSAGDVINRAVIPPGHSLSSKALQIVKDTIPGMNGFPSPQIALLKTAGANSTVIDFDTAVNVDPGYRYWALQYNLSTNGFVISVGELWLGTRTALSSSAYISPSWVSEYDQELAQENYGGRTATVQLSPARKKFRLEVVNLDPAGADFAVLDQVIKTGRARPFYYWPPDDTDPGPYLVQLSSSGTRRQEFRAPQAAIRYAVTLEMVEQLT